MNHDLHGDGDVIFNESGIDRNFRIESLNDANMLFLDGGTNRVGIGIGTPSQTLDVDGSIRMRGGTTTAGWVPTSSGDGTMVWTDPALLGSDVTTASNGLTEVTNDIRLGGSLTQNTTVAQGAFTLDFTSTAVDGFSVDGTTFSVDASNNRIGIGTNTPAHPLHLEISSGSGLNFPLLIRNQGAVDGVGAGIGFNLHGGNPAVKAAIFNERQNNYSADGKIHFLMSSTQDNTPVNLTSDIKMTIQSNGRVGIGDSSPDARLDVDATSGNLLILAQNGTQRALVDINGNLTISGKMNSNGIEELSDIRFKKDITPLPSVLNKVLEIEGVTYNWRREEFPEKAFGERTEVGFIAQELEKYFPELVNTDKDGYKSVQYSHMVPVLLEAIKEQQHIISTLNNEVSELQEFRSDANDKMNEMRTSIEQLLEETKILLYDRATSSITR